MDACWALAYISDGPDERIDIVLEHKVVPKMVNLLSCENVAVIPPALRCLGNIVTGNDQQTQVRFFSYPFFSAGTNFFKKKTDFRLS